MASRQERGWQGQSGVVVVLPVTAGGEQARHEAATHHALAERLAAILDFDFGGDYDPSSRYEGALYFVPSDTLADPGQVRDLGIRDEHSLFGGVVPYPFVATKTITHPLPAPQAHSPAGWSTRFSDEVAEVVLPGYSAFTLDDALTAGMRLLDYGPVRVKLASGKGGLGQWVAHDAEELRARLAQMDAAEIARGGLVCERNLAHLTTSSVGQVRVRDMLVTYYGEQRLTQNNAGTEVYGGSDLTLVRGDFDSLLRTAPNQQVRTAVAQARVYHVAALSSFPGMFASRCNYDIAQGVDEDGQPYSGVLEQSWRIGGASGAELVALEAFRRDPALDTVRASTTEVYGETPQVPADAVVYFSGADSDVGPLTKYARLEAHVSS